MINMSYKKDANVNALVAFCKTVNYFALIFTYSMVTPAKKRHYVTVDSWMPLYVTVDFNSAPLGPLPESFFREISTVT
jgi:hypothetical protein